MNEALKKGIAQLERDFETGAERDEVIITYAGNPSEGGTFDLTAKGNIILLLLAQAQITAASIGSHAKKYGRDSAKEVKTKYMAALDEALEEAINQ